MLNLKLISLRRNGRDFVCRAVILIDISGCWTGGGALPQSWSPAVYTLRTGRLLDRRPSHSVNDAFRDAVFVASRLIDRSLLRRPTDLCYSSVLVIVVGCSMVRRLPLQAMVRGHSHGMGERPCAVHDSHRRT